MELFKLSFLFFEIVEIWGVPRGTGGEDRGSFEGGYLIEAGGECVIVKVD